LADEPGWVELTRDFGAWKQPTGDWVIAGDAALDPDNPRKLVSRPGKGVLVTGRSGKARDLVSKEKFGDVEVHVEFLISKRSNSGVKFEGLYEIQIFDSHGAQKLNGASCGGIYPRAELKPRYHHLDDGVAPRVNAARPAGEWQTLDAVFLAPRFDAAGKKIQNARVVKAVLNGQVIHEDVELKTPTGHAWSSQEVATGPLLLQGDHGPVAFRNVRIRSYRPAAKTHQIPLNGHTFTLPTGFTIEVVAGPPLVNRPIEADFDEGGRLYVTDSSGSNEPVTVQLQKKPHRVVRLVDSKGDGRFDQATVFADKLMFPEGALWHAGSLYVAAPPSVWKLTDTKGAGVADQRVEWFQGKTLTGCANDLHGPYAGPDGWIYWCKGAFAQQTYERPGGPRFVTRASHIFRCRPDGSGLEPVMTGGMDNPVELVFTPGGERIITTTFFQHPGGGKRDGLIHAVYGGIYGKDHDVIHDPAHKWTSLELMPVLTHMGPAAPCGLVRYESSVFGPDYQDNLFATLFNLHKVTRHVLTPDGATFRCHDEDFLVSDNPDFHPTDVLEDADGSLLVIDTGGWYKLCCPTSQLHKPDVLGAIYRIRRVGAPRIDDPRGLKLAWTQLTSPDLAKLLGDPRPAVRRRAVAALATKGHEAVPSVEQVLRDSRSAEARRNAVWAATRIEGPDARAAVRAALSDADETVRQTAIHSVSVWRDHTAVPALHELLSGHSPQNRRAAAEALGRIHDRSAVPALLESVSQPGDRMLEHSLLYALIEIADRDETAAGLRSANLATRRAALIALDQMTDGKLDAASVAKELTSPDAKLKETAWWIAGRHPEWSGALAGFFRERLAAKGLPAAERDGLAHQLARLARAKPTQELLAELIRDPGVSHEARRIVLRAMAQAGLREAPAAWRAGVMKTLTGDDRDLRREAVATARALHLPKKGAEDLLAVLLMIGKDGGVEDDVRLQALAVPAALADVPPALFTFLQSMLWLNESPGRRAAAADVLARANLSPDQLIDVAAALDATGPMEINRLLEAFARSGDEKVGQRLIATLKSPRIRPALRAETLRRCLAKYGPAVQKQAADLYASLDADAGKQKAHLEQLLTTLKSGDIRRGQAIFNSTKAACSSCHAIGYLGGNVGPDLTHIGQIRTERDLLESIVYPSASLAQGFQPVVVTTKDGRLFNGLIRKDGPDEVVLVTGANQEARIARDDIDDIAPSKVSVMPAGLEQQLTPRDLADLVAFLKACK
jgi:putative membrane-bound dehydrogenase-like protein